MDVRVVNVGRPALCPFSLSPAGTFWPVLTGSSHTVVPFDTPNVLVVYIWSYYPHKKQWHNNDSNKVGH